MSEEVKTTGRKRATARSEAIAPWYKIACVGLGTL